MQAATETPVKLELHRVVGGAGVVVRDDVTVAWADKPSNKATAQSTHVSHRKCLLPDGLLDRSVPLPGVWEVVAVCCADRTPRTYSKRVRRGNRPRATGGRSERLVEIIHGSSRVVVAALKAALPEIEKASRAYAQYGLSRSSVMYLPANPQARREIRPGGSVKRFSGWHKVNRRKIGRICDSADDRRLSGAHPGRRIHFPPESVRQSEPPARFPCVLDISRKCFHNIRSARNIVEYYADGGNRARIGTRLAVKAGEADDGIESEKGCHRRKPSVIGAGLELMRSRTPGEVIDNL